MADFRRPAIHARPRKRAGVWIRSLAELKSAVTKAADTSAGVCPAQIPRSAHERLVFLEKRLAALREAVHVIVPAFEAFHASLNDEQKARLDSGPRGWRWPRSSGD
jgi:hypothetical protein